MRVSNTNPLAQAGGGGGGITCGYSAEGVGSTFQCNGAPGRYVVLTNNANAGAMTVQGLSIFLAEPPSSTPPSPPPPVSGDATRARAGGGRVRPPLSGLASSVPLLFGMRQKC